MADFIKDLDPVQGLIDYVNDIKPYHTKIIESLVEYVGTENVNISILENYLLDIGLDYSYFRPFSQTYTVVAPITVIPTSIPIYSNSLLDVNRNCSGSPAIGSPPCSGSPPIIDIYSSEFHGTIVYVNGILQTENSGSPLVGDYSIIGGNIVFNIPLIAGDIVEIFTSVRGQDIPRICTDGGFGALPFDDPDIYPVVSPDPMQTLITFPAMTTNALIVLGVQRSIFDPTKQLTFKVTSSIEEVLLGATIGTGSPPTGGTFTVIGNKSTFYSINDIIIVDGTFNNNGAYKLTNVIVNAGSPVTTTLVVDGQTVPTTESGGFIKTFDSNNNGEFTVVSSIYTPGTATISDYTTVFISGITLVPPVSVGLEQTYVSNISVRGIEYTKILSYSNALRYYNAILPQSLLQTPDEGDSFAAITSLVQGSPSYFVVEGNYEVSNVFVGDEFSVIGSTDNNTTYIIESLSTNFVGSPESPFTTIGVASIHNSIADGFAKITIPSNVFFIDKDYTDFIKQGTQIKVLTGSKTGTYSVIGTTFINNETQIRVHEDIIDHKRGRMIQSIVVGSPSQGFVVSGDLTSMYKQSAQFNVTMSIRNDGAYSVAVDAAYDSVANTTTIFTNEPFDETDDTGEIHEFNRGVLTLLSPGFGQTPELCEVVPETIVSVSIIDKLYLDNINIWTGDDVIAYGIDADLFGYDLPPTTIFASVEPTITISDTAPVSPVIDTLWFDTSPNTLPVTAPGIFKQYVDVPGSPAQAWVTIQGSKAYWIDTDTNYMYYRIMYQYYDPDTSSYPTPSLANGLDTEWVLEFTKIPGFSETFTATDTRGQIGVETFFAVESTTGVANTTFNLNILTIPVIGSPAVPDSSLVEVYLNGVISDINILSTTSFDILSPEVRVDDFVEVRTFDHVVTPSNTFVGTFDTNAAITEDFTLLKGYQFHIDATEATGSPPVSKIYIPDDSNGQIYDIIKPGSPRTLADTTLEIINSEGSPTINGIYTILDAVPFGSPVTHLLVTVAEPILNTGTFGSPISISGKVLFLQWFQYLITNTTANTIVVSGDATTDIQNGNTIKIIYSYNSPNNDGNYTVNAVPTFDGTNTTITTLETISITGNSGGWVESI